MKRGGDGGSNTATREDQTRRGRRVKNGGEGGGNEDAKEGKCARERGGKEEAKQGERRRQSKEKGGGKAGGHDKEDEGENDANSESGVTKHGKGPMPQPKNDTITTSERSDDPTTTRVQRSGDELAQQRPNNE